MSYEKYKDTIKATNVARREAVKLLIENHREEFDNLYIEVADRHGLNPSKIKSQVTRSQLKKEEI